MRGDWQKLFLKAYEETGYIGYSAAKAGVSRRSVEHCRAKDPIFRKKFKRSARIARSVVADELMRRAVQGVEEPVFQGGKQVGTIRKFSDVCLIFLAKALAPKKFNRAPYRPPEELAGEAEFAIRLLNAQRAMLAQTEASPSKPNS